MPALLVNRPVLAGVAEHTVSPTEVVFHIGTAMMNAIPMPSRIEMVMVAWIASVSFFISFPTILQILQQLPTNSCRTLSPNISDNHPTRSRHLSRWANCHRSFLRILDSSFVGLLRPLRRFLFRLPIGAFAPQTELRLVYLWIPFKLAAQTLNWIYCYWF